MNKDKTIINILVQILAFTIGIIHILNINGVVAFSAMTLRATHLLFMILIALLMGMDRDTSSRMTTKILDVISMMITIVSSTYILYRWRQITLTGGITNSTDAIMGSIFVLALIYLTSERIGKILAGIVVIFLIYPFVGQYLPGLLHSRAYNFQRVFNFLFTGTQGVYGIPISVSASYIIMFSIYGAFLNNFGIGDFLFKLSSSITERLIGGTAKTAVIFSGLIGMISGTAAGNVAVTGSITIPMMKKAGYKPNIAAAIEAIASTGGQIMPPIMGAAAFIMAELTNTPYTQIMKAALIPALLYFASIYAVIHLIAHRDQIDSREEKASARTEKIGTFIKKDWYLILPVISLIVLLVIGMSPLKSAYYSIIVMLINYLIVKRDFSRNFIVKVVNSIIDGVKNTVLIAIACGVSGVIVGVVSLTGIGAKLSNSIISVSGGEAIIALLLTMTISIILGMGLPTTAAYLIPVSILTPALVKMGIPLLTAHLFIFVFACISTITPPVALASYVAAGISGADISKVGWTGFRLGIASFILPYMLVYNPGIMISGTGFDIALAIIRSLIGVFVIAVSATGYYKASLKIPTRVLLFIAGVLMTIQDNLYNLIGILIIAICAVLINRTKKEDSYEHSK